ncbi:hypothetical protein TNCT_249371 [Trichonephila clavata]|uniref:Uncharacterized protein n=1 Tax=Trichonephila clavata TaxID=2740835 RepID=A0A8X6HHG7_TRICU|nr:hypothetical protein TNCT_249371 [Trichonephila clavata]
MQPLLSTLKEALESRYQFKTQPLCWDACFSCSLYTKGSSATRVICLTLAVGLNIVLFFIPQSDLKFVGIGFCPSLSNVNPYK